MKRPSFFRVIPALVGGALLITSAPAKAQGGGGPGPGGPGIPTFTDPSIKAVAPAYNQSSAAAASDIQVIFGKPVVLAGGSPLAVWGSLTGRRSGALSGSGTRQIRFNPAQDWLPGEEVTMLYQTTPATLDQAQPGLALTSGTAVHFRAATAPAVGPLAAVSTPPAIGLVARQVEVADLDGDGDVDMVLLGTDNVGAGRVMVVRRDAAGYTTIANLATSATAAMALGDLNNDGLNELVVSDAAAPTATVTVYRNPGTGVFTGGLSSTVSAGAGAHGLRIADITNDNLLDLITVNTDGTISKRFNNGSGGLDMGSLVPGASITTVIAGVRTILPCALVDGNMEQAFVGTTNAVRYYFRGESNGSYGASGVFVATGINPVNDLVAADFTGDSLLDVLISTTNGLLLARHNAPTAPGGAFLVSTLMSGTDYATAKAADVDGDGDLDILAAATAANGLQILRNDGTGSFTVETPLALNAAGSQPAWVAAADLNGDGTMDAVTANGLLTNSATMLLNTAPNGSRNAVVSTVRQLSGSYDNVTVTGTGNLSLGADLVVTGTLTVQSGGTLRLSGYQLRGAGAVVVQPGATVEVYSAAGLTASGATGDVQNTGARTFSAGARYVFRGFTPQQSGPAMANSVLDLVVDNPQGVTLTNNTAVTRAVILTNGNLTSNGKLTLVGSATGTAQVINTAGAVLGTATMQRYIPGAANHGLGFRQLSSPVSNTTFSDLTTAGFTPRVNALFNTNPAAVPAASYPNIFAYNESRLTGSGPSADFGQGWMSPTALSEPMVSGKGYTVHLTPANRPDFTGILSNDTISSGTLTRGSTTESGWQLLGNPYPSPIDWDVLAASLPATMSKQVSVFRSTGVNSGTYVTRINNVSTPDPSGVLANGWIGAMQGFFTRVVTPGSTSFNFTNAARPTGLQTAAVYRTAAMPQVQLSATAAADPAQVDYATVYATRDATTGFDAAFDAWKQHSVGAPSLFTLASGTADELAINAIAPLTDADVVVPVGLIVPAAGTYYLTAAVGNLPGGWHVMLEDALTATAYDMTQAAPYAISLAAGTVATNRLQLRFTTNRVTGLHEAAGQGALGLTLSPNPAREAVQLHLRSAVAENATIAVLDARGVVVHTQKLATGQAEASLALGHLPAGVYLVRVGSLTQRLVVQ